MNKFIKRNFIELRRNKALYIFLFLFPILLTLLFSLIKHYSVSIPLFELKSLIPGIMIFSFSFITLLVSLLISKDKSSLFLKRLFISPLKTLDFLFGYLIPYFIMGLIQSILTILLGFILSLILNEEFISILDAFYLFLVMIPLLLINIFIGIILGFTLSDKTSPLVSSIFITVSSILSGAWIPIETMGNFKWFALSLPFYPSVYLGRIIAKAKNSYNLIYSFDSIGKLSILIILAYLILSFLISIFSIRKSLYSSN